MEIRSLKCDSFTKLSFSIILEFQERKHLELLVFFVDV